MITRSKLTELVQNALNEDLPLGDLTTDFLGKENILGEGKVLAKEDLVLSGCEVFECVLKQFDNLQITWFFRDGDFVLNGQIICRVHGNLMNLLKAERTALNFLGHMSGIATLTRCFVKAVQGTKTSILDTRKTLPGLREIEKLAVRHGGGINHRFSLSDQIMIKDNHIQLCGGISKAVHALRAQHAQGDKVRMTVEAQTLAEVSEAVALSVNRILLDNMSIQQLREAVAIIPSEIETEASGNMTLERVREVALTGVQFISVGALTHSAPQADISLKFEWKTNQQ